MEFIKKRDCEILVCTVIHKNKGADKLTCVITVQLICIFISALAQLFCCKNYYITKTRPCNIQICFKCKNENFHQEKFDIFLIFAQNMDCGYTLEPPRRGGSNEYPQSMFWSKNKKNRYTPVNPSFSI